MTGNVDGRGTVARRFAGCTSILVLAAMGSGRAHAQCAPNPSQAYQATTCSGTQTGGYTIATDQSPLTVTAGSSIQNTGDALTVSIPANSYFDYRSTAITVNGSIASSGGNGILLNSGAPYQPYYPDFVGTSATIIVAAGGSVSGTTGITLAPYPGYTSVNAPASATLDNMGSIMGAAGTALATSGNGNFSTITNEATGSLGAIAASFSSLVNHGTIDGGVLSAVANPAANFPSIANDGTIQAEGTPATVQLNNSYSFTNSGTISNSGGGAAINVGGNFINQVAGTVTANGSDVVTGGYLTVSNAGSISNSGSGQAVSGNSLNLTNYSGATINGGSNGIAVNGTTGLTLVNMGTINGSVLAGSAASTYQSFSVDSSQGTINGNVTFGNGQNILIATLNNGAVQTGVTGTITGGSGTNTLQVTATADVALSTSVALPANFTQLSLAPTYGTTLTLASGFSNSGTIFFDGNGTLSITGSLRGSGEIIRQSAYNSLGTLNNSGTISSANAGGAAAIFSAPGNGTFINSGTISASGDAVDTVGNAFTNSGSITAGSTAVRAYVGGPFANSGTITSTGGIAVNLQQTCTCTIATNSGSIIGAQIGLSLNDGVMINTGVITSAGYGVALNYYGTVENSAGGTITGGIAGIGDPGGAPGIDIVSNAGIINGNVNLTNGGFGANAFYAIAGGILNGNLTLGSGDTLISDLPSGGSGPFAGINGTVTADNSNLVYNVAANATTTANTPAGFGSVVYQLANAPTLIFASGSTLTGTLGLAGAGTVLFNGTITSTDAAGLMSQSYRPEPNGSSVATALAITNTGTIATTRANPGLYLPSAVSLENADTLVNAGTITMTDSSGNAASGEAVVSGGLSITNTGTIAGTGTSAVSLGYFYANSQPSLTNSGTISSDETTVIVNSTAPIVNTGTISSTGGAAIAGPAGNPYYFYYSSAQVTNLAGGTISGNTDAIDLSGGTVSNAGTINGNVNLAYVLNGYPNQSSGVYVDNGGTVNGNLTLNAYDALEINLANAGNGPLGGVTGAINANGAALIYMVGANAITTPAATSTTSGFGAQGYLLSNNAVLTFSAASATSATLSLAGSGSVILNGSFTGNDTPAVQTQPQALLAATGNSNAINTLTITNNGRISTTDDVNATSTVALLISTTDTLINNGTISLANTGAITPSAVAIVGGLAITNTGTIAATGADGVSLGAYYSGNTEALINSGAITSDQYAVILNGSAAITNSGTIASTGAAAIGAGVYYNNVSGQVTNLAGGSISGSGDAIDLQGGIVNNAGTVNGNVNLAYSPYGTSYVPGAYIANGGTLNGNLTLGQNQALVIDLSAAASSPLGGITGTINANGAALVYNVTASATTTPTAEPGGFGTMGYLLSNNATLTFASNGNLYGTLEVAGSGSVILNESITSYNASALLSQSQALLAPTGYAGGGIGLIITNNATISTIVDYSGSTAISVYLDLNDSFINKGVVNFQNTGIYYAYGAAIAGGKSITNVGNISGSSANGIILGSFDGNISGNLTNSGIITSDQYGVLVTGSPVVSNSGTIVSTGTAAIGSANDFFASNFVRVNNLATGIITGVGDAIELEGGTVSNAGIINGNVNLAYSPYGFGNYYTGAYIDNGGTLHGNLTLTQGEALVVDLATATNSPLGGVTGTINANGAAIDYIVSADATITAPPPLPAGFGAVGYLLSNNPTLTLDAGVALTTTLGIVGSGSVILNGTVTTTDQNGLQSQAFFGSGATAASHALAITNNGTIATTFSNYNYFYNVAAVTLQAGDTLVNNGAISLINSSGSPDPSQSAVSGGLSVTNIGTISGAGVSAIQAGIFNSTITEQMINLGTVSSDQYAVFVAGPATISNSGTIASTGMAAIGNAIAYLPSTNGSIQVTNLAGGVITGAGEAIDLAGGTVGNAGTINGNVNLAYSPYGYPVYAQGAYFANGGTLNGNLTLGAAESLVTGLGTFNNGSVTGITGTVTPDGAALAYTVSADATTTASVPTGFGVLAYELSNDATLTLASDTALSGTLFLAGSGSVIFDGTIATNGLPAFSSVPLLTTAGFSASPNALNIINNGSISATSAGTLFLAYAEPSAVSLGSADTLVNSGTISLANISATPNLNIAAVIGGQSITNSGTLAGIGYAAVLIGDAKATAPVAIVNSGAITSDQNAIEFIGPATLANSGTIASTGTTAIINSATSPTQVTNLAGGVITGNGDAIDVAGGTVSNAGTINGNVNLAYSPTVPLTRTSGTFFASGGVLNGNLTLGAGQSLVTNLVNDGSGAFSGIAGSVNSSNSNLIYNVTANATATAALPTGFAMLSYQLVNNPVLTLTSPSNLTSTLGLAGTGAVIFDGTISTTNAVALQSQPLVTDAGISSAANALAITTNGAIAAAFDGASTAAKPGAVALGSGDALINNGTITASTANPSPGFAVVSSGRQVANAGTITGTGLSGISLGSAGSPAAAALVLANSGTIASDQYGVVLMSPGSVTNSGTINGAAGAFVASGTTTIVNSGTIASSAGVAILSPGPGTTNLTNASGGKISGATAAIDLAGGLVDNAGGIAGNVDLGYVTANAPANASPAIYFVHGGTLTGNLAFASTGGGNELIETGLGFGVSGTISGGPGANYVGHLRNVSGTVTLPGTLPGGFTDQYTVAQGAGTQVTITGPAASAANIIIGGNGAIVNQANTSGIIENLAASGESYLASMGLQLAALTNQANLGGIAITTASLVNSGTVGLAGSTAPVVAQTASGPLSFTNSGTIDGGIVIRAAIYSVTDSAAGSITGNIIIQPLLATGSASGSIALAGGFAGSIEGGAGATTSLAVSGGSAARPVAFGSIADVASYRQSGGFATLAGTASLGTTAITGGTFIGLVGSTLTASQVSVAAGATFASGGTINGNLAVGGTLHVGASPDTMTVNGNVALASGSTSVFEVSPTASAKLVASGAVTIAANTTLQIVQLQPVAPGTSIDLIDASGGITGDFTTLTGFDGALVEKNDELSLLALFNASQAANPQVAHGVNYLNALLLSGNAPAPLVAALPALQPAGGAPSPSAFARLTPEAYATATQIGVENALIVSRTARAIGWDKALHSGNLFTFGEALGNWHELGGNGALGVSRADLSGHGFIGGLGIGSSAASLAAFGGYLDQSEAIAGLAVTTHAKGFVGGVTGRLASGPAQLNLSVIYDDAHASTLRLSPDDIQLSGGYQLHGWTVDGEASTSIALGADWSAHPHAGATWVWTRRGSTIEASASAFALSVAADHHQAGFVDGGVRFASRQGDVGQLSGFVDFGVRYQVEGRATDAVAGLGGGPVALLGYGVRRRPAGTTVESGATWRATGAVSLFVTGGGELSRGDSSESVTGGVSVRF